MKKSLIFLFCLLVAFFFSSCIQSIPSISSASDDTVMLHWLDMDQEGLVRQTKDDQNASSSDSLFSGKAIETFEQSPTKSVSSWKKGKRHGKTTEYFYNGRKRRIITYENGERNGISREFRITGELLTEETYSDSKLNGPKSEWHPNGTKAMEVQMKDGKPHGTVTEWYPDGTKKSSTIYRHGLREGPSSEWYLTGQQKLGLFYQKDKQHGLRTIWYDNGKKRLTAQFVDDKMEGNSKGWFPNGQQQFDYNFKNNLEHGVCAEWNEDGQKISELQFINGEPIQDLLTGRSIKLIEKSDSVEIPKPPTPSSEELSPETTEKPPPPTVVQEDVSAVEKNNTPTETAVSKEETDSDPITEGSPATSATSQEANRANPTPSTFDPFSTINESGDSAPEKNLGISEKVPPPPPPLPPSTAPSFDPFATGPITPVVPSDTSEIKAEQPPAPAVVAPSPPQPAPPPSFNPFENNPLPAVQEEKPNAQSLSEPFPQADTIPPPTLNPFSDSDDMLEKQNPGSQDANLYIPPPPPPPAAPTFNPFDNDPLPLPPPGLGNSLQPSNVSNNPFESAPTDDNKSSVPLENIFTVPPAESAPAGNFNPFDLPVEN